MSYEPDIHKTQTLILRKLLFVPRAGFAELQKETDLTSDHFNFHIKKLIESGYVQKENDAYTLTHTGKEYANRLDTDAREIERQPKLSVLLLIERDTHDRKEYLCQQRLKHPYYGYWGRFGGKVRWGESLGETARRELLEETGLSADFTFLCNFRKRDYKKSDNTLLEDKLFVVMKTKNPVGTLIDGEGCHNEWLTDDELRAKEKHYSSALTISDIADKNIPYFAGDYFYEDDEY